jgi:hypothetical protein
VLLNRGHHPDQRLVKRHRGSDVIAMTGKIGELAKLEVYETGNGPKFRRFQGQRSNDSARALSQPAHAFDELPGWWLVALAAQTHQREPAVLIVPGCHGLGGNL